MTTDALPNVTLGRFEHRLRIVLIVAFLAIAALLVCLGVWLERPFRALPVETQRSGELGPSTGSALSTEVAR